MKQINTQNYKDFYDFQMDEQIESGLDICKLLQSSFLFLDKKRDHIILIEGKEESKQWGQLSSDLERKITDCTNFFVPTQASNSW